MRLRDQGLSQTGGEEIEQGRLAAVSLSPEPMMRQLGLIYRKDKALSRAALGFIQVILEHAGNEIPGAARPKLAEEVSP